ncbi:CinA family protein [Cupriavidus pampae]|uniref:CinA family protein n=1 Tax=Cupriavidus pampae TaxID=659251 RepID=UPI001CC5023A|nr:nicotinamide-nucleotide amidohydrolase family protein [Cupriavidus pampae]
MSSISDVAQFLIRHRVILATAESCTAGLIASRVAEIPGTGDVLKCAIVAYAPAIKTSLLHVPRSLIEKEGLTSEAVSFAMAVGIMRLCDVDLAIANTGVADGGADDETKSGTQCFAWIWRRRDRCAGFTETRRFIGERNIVRNAAAEFALTRVPSLYERFQRGEGTAVVIPVSRAW